jgi:hypothetical protein
MAEDGLQVFYAERLWQLLPRHYRSSDPLSSPEGRGPLRELVDRIGAAIADQRRSIDVLGRLASVETADDWAIAYLADLLSTRLVSSMDARAQRLDVARTIAYRRRAGTMALIELLGFDVSGHDVKATEFFRRLLRSRHRFDPGFAESRAVLAAERLIGRASGTPAGGTADLRDDWAAAESAGPFDEFSHTADFRRPGQSRGHHAVPRVGVYVYWLYAWSIAGATPVVRAGCPDEFTFDPTGRDVQLYGAGGRSRQTLAESWTSPHPWELPLAIGKRLWRKDSMQLYPGSLAVLLAGGGTPAPAPLPSLRIDPEAGRFRFPAGAPAGEVLSLYHHALAGPVGAMGQPDTLPPLENEPATQVVVSGGAWGAALASPVAAAGRTILFDDSRTLPGPAGPVAVVAGATLVLRARSERRPVVRWTATASTLRFTGGDAGSSLILRGLYLQGAEIELAGVFGKVVFQQCTLDPGSLDNTGAIATAIDGVALGPMRIRVTGRIDELVIERSILGPIVTTGNGFVEQLSLSDSIVQAIRPNAAAIDLNGGDAGLARTTVMGPAQFHRLNASDCIFDERVKVTDVQDGCIRFCTYANGSRLHAPYRSVAIPARSAIFHSRRFGTAGYARVRFEADRAMVDPDAGQSIIGGASDGSEPGAFCTERAGLKHRSLAIKLEEFMPIGTIPVLIDAK